MDSVGVERAGLQKDLDEVNAEIRRVKERLEDGSFVTRAKPALVEDQLAQLRQLEARRARLEENLKHLGESQPGGLPSTQSGTWSPLVLHEQAPRVDRHDEALPVRQADLALPGGVRSSSPSLSKQIAEVVVRRQSGQAALNQLGACLVKARAGTDIRDLQLLAAALTGLGATKMAIAARARIQDLGGVVPLIPGLASTEPIRSPQREVEALPDSRDGLTKLQRRVISVMYVLSFKSGGPLKPTKLVLEELHQLDPRLTSADLDSALGELTQPWARVNPLIQVSGLNCRLTSLAEELFVGVETDIVDFEPGSSLSIPLVLPARVPALLAKGTDGIPPHHLGELIDAATYLLEYRHGAAAKSLLSFVRGPDFPTGGVLKHTPHDLYTREQGEVVVEARLELQTERDSERARYVVSELPWPLEAAAVARRLEALAIDGVQSIREDQGSVIIELDHVAYGWWVKVALDRSGLLVDRRFIELRINVGGQARSCNLAQVLNYFLEHRIDIFRRRITHELPRRQERAEVLEGLLVTAEFTENVLAVLRDADDPAEAKWGLMHLASPELRQRASFARHTPADPVRLAEVVAGLMNRLLFDVPRPPSHSYALGFSERQASAILTTRKLSALQRDSLFREWLECCLEVARLEVPEHGVKEAEALVLAELEKLKVRYARPRRTQARH